MTDFRLLTTDVERAARAVLRGGLVAIPTETVYGLGADADDEEAVGRIFDVKGRPRGHPLIVHLAGVEALDHWARSVPAAARALAEAAWPGPLTLLLPRTERVLDVVTGGRDTVGLRVPAHPLTAALLRRTGRGIAAPSANRFGRVSPTTAAHVLADLGPYLDAERDVVLDGGPSPIGVESTIVDCSVDPPQLLRPGGIPTESVARLLDLAVAPARGASRAPGMLTSHYAPRTPVVLVEDRSSAEQAVAAAEHRGQTVLVLDPGDDLVAAARDLYASLRAADDAAVDQMVAILPPPRGLGHAIRDRLVKAAAPRQS